MQRHLPILCCLILPAAGLYKLSEAIPWQTILGYLLLVSITTYVSYWQDKYKAQKDECRLSERSLHFF